MQDFSEQIRDIYEAAFRCEGYDDVKAIVVDQDADCKSDPRMKALVEQGYRFIDENFFGEGASCLGKVVIFVKGQSNG